MSSFLAFSYSVTLSESEKLLIDERVLKNRKNIRKFLKKSCCKIKVVIISTTFGVTIWIINLGSAGAISTVSFPSSSPSPTESVIVMPKLDSVKVEYRPFSTITMPEFEKMDSFDSTQITDIDSFEDWRGGQLPPSSLLYKMIWLALKLLEIEGFTPLPLPGFNKIPSRALIRPKFERNFANQNNQAGCNNKQNSADGTMTKAQKRNQPHEFDEVAVDRNGNIALQRLDIFIRTINYISKVLNLV